MRALTFVRELGAQCQRMTLSTPGYRQRPELGDGIRSCVHGHYVIFFKYGARDIPAVFGADPESPMR